ncbi:MAG: hypothetical protein OEU36_20310 [Gammaproteobacteria bacterium]|nr:hypothetical protein [Gammaproteobacteria bacterium]
MAALEIAEHQEGVEITLDEGTRGAACGSWVQQARRCGNCGAWWYVLDMVQRQHQLVGMPFGRVQYCLRLSVNTALTATSSAW